MEEPTPSDVLLIQRIVDLTDSSGGRPPTLAEIAVALGLQSSSRANIQRQLARLKPTYVDWSSSPRSLRVTANGLALLQVSPRSTLAADQLPVDEPILPSLASGLTRMVREVGEGAPLQAPYPAPWQRAVNKLAMACLLRGVAPPAHTVEAIAWCRTAPTTWPVAFAAHSAPVQDQPLLEGDLPTDFCRELAQSIPANDAELELTERIMVRVRDAASIHRKPETYVAVRRYLIEHPVVTADELLEATHHPTMSAFSSDLQELYERVPTDVIENSVIMLCGHCGWTLEHRPWGLQCGDDRCRVLTHNFTSPVPRQFPVLPGEEVQRVRRAIRRYVVAPGTYERDLAERLVALQSNGQQPSVDLWPGYDRYDIRITFPNGARWAVDVKDWRFAHLLAPTLDALQPVGGEMLTRTFYAVPDVRVRENPGYLNALRSATATRDFAIVTIDELVQLARAYLENPNA